MTEKRKKRRQFGTVLLRRNPSGKAQTWIGRYTYKGIRCQRSFGKDGRIQAQSWLEEEKLLVDLGGNANDSNQSWKKPRNQATAPLIETNPFILPIPSGPEPESWRIRPVDGKTLRMRYVAMPAYTRIAVYLSALAGGEAGDFLKHDRQGANATRFLRGPSVMWMGPA